MGGIFAHVPGEPAERAEPLPDPVERGVCGQELPEGLQVEQTFQMQHLQQLWHRVSLGHPMLGNATLISDDDQTISTERADNRAGVL